MPNLLVATVLLVCSCTADLPPGWEDAETIDNFTQTACGSEAESPAPTIAAEGRNGEVHLGIDNARFRCQQSVEGYLRRDGSALLVLVQPEDMTPGSVMKCDCGYDLRMAFGATPGEHLVSVFFRSDRYGSDGEPRMWAVDSVELTVP